MNDTVKTITYDNGSGQLTLSDQSGDHATLQRVARPAGVTGIMREAVDRSPAGGDTQTRWSRSAGPPSDGPVVASTTADERGKFEVTVAPGEYWVVPVAKGDEQVVSDRVTVRPGAYGNRQAVLLSKVSGA